MPSDLMRLVYDSTIVVLQQSSDDAEKQIDRNLPLTLCAVYSVINGIIFYLNLI